MDGSMNLNEQKTLKMVIESDVKMGYDEIMMNLWMTTFFYI